ncbi:hypothetical protein CCR80_04555 [Rhodothalassium salexigens]|uniref:TonB-dependent receptor domain-containing protein n=1 Tax=Rhodothalassium salexigens TaxID=1086 RepID=UPI001911E689|nr:TonB-dependent receptor [Rhodothalassium salexigens]MBK5920310.1 hypothetical protein [Rhodothalassium salexigens]
MAPYQRTLAPRLGTSALALILAAPLATAQQVDESPGDADLGVEEIVVTGSRITTGNVNAPSPVTTINAAEIDSRGIVRVEDLINTLPQAFAAQGANVSNGATGTSTINLRGLGATRTLVLVDGRRLPFGSPTSAPQDINLIPAQLIERVEVLTGGASAVYGADAVGGVTNFIMRRDFEGIQFDMQGSVFQAGNNNASLEQLFEENDVNDPGPSVNGRNINATFLVGGNFADGRGNATGYVTYQNQNPVLQATRDISGCAFGLQDEGRRFSCLGSSTTFPARLTDFGLAAGPAGAALDAFNRAIDEGRLPADAVPAQSFDLYVEPDGSGVDQFDAATDTFNFNPFNFFIRPNERFNVGAFLNYQLTDKVEAFLDFQFMDDRTNAQIAPGGTFFQTETINCDNPLLTDTQLQSICQPNAFVANPNFLDDEGNPVPGQDQFVPLQQTNPDTGAAEVPLFIGRRLIEGGNRNSDIRHTTYRVVGGFRGQLSERWDFDVSGQFANVIYSETSNNNIFIPNLALALDVVEDPVTGEPVCRREGVIEGCAPFDIFTIGNVTDEALDFIQQPGFNNGEVTQAVFIGTVSGDLTGYGFKSPFAGDGVQTVFGFEYRQDQLDFNSDFVQRNGLLGGVSPDVDGTINVYEFFNETAVPLVQNKRFAESLDLTGAVRFSEFNTTGSQITWAAGATYAPTGDVRFRVQYQQATRSPNPIELFEPQSLGLVDLTVNPNGLYDPCASAPGIAPAASLQQCLRTGATEAQYLAGIADNPAGQFNQLQGGNEDLETEKAETLTIGAVITPRFAPGLTLSLDYYTIQVDDFISTVPSNLALTECLETGDAFFCSLIQRGAGGQLFVGNDAFIEATNVNTGTLETSGIDVNMSYSFDFADLGLAGAGAMSLEYVATYLLALEIQPLPGQDSFDCAGKYGGACAEFNPAAPEYRHRLLVNWQTPFGFDLIGTWRHFNSVSALPVTGPINQKLPSENYFDMSLNAMVSDYLRVRVGVNNVFDNDPPLSSIVGAGFGNGNTFPQVYDALGRFIFAGFTVSF